MSSLLKLISAFLLATSLFCFGQTATCRRIDFFQGFAPSGIDRQGTVVGAYTASLNYVAGVIRYDNGLTQTYVAPGAEPPTDWTYLTRRNSLGATVGWYRDSIQDAHGLLLVQGKTTTIDDPGFAETIPYGINDSGTIVGIASDDFSQAYAGFEMSPDGTFTTIQYPGAAVTNPTSISNTGVVVGWYQVSVGVSPSHGFILTNGTYQTVDYPTAEDTILNDINTAGVAVGTQVNFSTGSQGGFLYSGGTFEDIASANLQTVQGNGINDKGYVTGIGSGFGFENVGYTAQCK